MGGPDIDPVKPKTPIKPVENDPRPQRDTQRRGRRTMIAAGRLTKKASGVKSSLLG